MPGRGFTGPLILLTIGFVLLFNNIGIIPEDIWIRLWLYWPIILILIGIDVMFCCGESKAVDIAALLIEIIVIIGAVMLASSGVPQIEYGNNMTVPDLHDKDLAGRDMNFADLKNANLSNSNLDGANLNFAYLDGADIVNSSMSGVNLNFANIENANLSYSYLNGANLNFADMRGANLTGASFEGANLFGTRTSKTTTCPDSRPGPCW